MSRRCSSSVQQDALCASGRQSSVPPPSSALEACDPDDEPPPSATGFDFPLDWKAVYRRTCDSEREGRVPNEVQQALR